MSHVLTPVEIAGIVADRFDEAGIPYAIGGALALAVHGAARMTSDVDVCVAVDDVDRLVDALERAGCRVARAAAHADVARSSLVRVTRGVIVVDVFVAFHSHHTEMFSRRVAIAGRWYVSAEDLAILKLVMARPKDVMDLELLFAAQGGRLDVAYVRRWLERIVPAGDPRFATLDDLERRFGS